MTALLDLKLVFVTGKGGVGKTTVASAMALLASLQGKRVLICEVDAKGDVAGFYEAPPTVFKEREVLPGLFAMTMDTEASLREYLKLQLRIPVVGRIGPLAKAFDFVATAAPGVREILTVGKLCYEVRERNYDLVVVDAPASGHIVGQLAAPQAINNLVKVGLIRSQTDWMLDILSDPASTGLVAVCTPEEMPVTETIELADRVSKETTVTLSAVVVNRVLPELFGRQEEEVFDVLGSGEALGRLNELVGADAVQGRERSVQDVVDALVAGALDGVDVGGLLDDAYQALIARGAGAVGAGVDVGDVVADGAEAQACLEAAHGFGEGGGIEVGEYIHQGRAEAKDCCSPFASELKCSSALGRFRLRRCILSTRIWVCTDVVSVGEAVALMPESWKSQSDTGVDISRCSFTATFCGSCG